MKYEGKNTPPFQQRGNDMSAEPAMVSKEQLMAEIASYVDAVSSASAAVIDGLERRSMEGLQNNITGGKALECIRDGKYDSYRVRWLKIIQIGLMDGMKPEAYFTALQNILLACRMPEMRLLFLIVGQGSGYEIFLGVEAGENIGPDDIDAAAEEISSFVKVSWKGVKCSVADDAERFRNTGYERIYAVTGIPSADAGTGYPSTLEYLMTGTSGGGMAYLVVAEPVANEAIDTVLSKGRDLLGQVESLKQISVSDAVRKGTSGSTTSGNNSGRAESNFDSEAEGLGGSLFGFSASSNSSRGKSSSVTSGEYHGITSSMSEDHSLTLGKTLVNASMDTAAVHIRKHNERYEAGKGIGMWNVGCYLFVEAGNTTIHTQLKSILSGENSKYEAIRTIDISKYADRKGKYCLKPFIQPPVLYCPDCIHPFGRQFSEIRTWLNTTELTSLINFPLHSVAGITVKEFAPFGRNLPEPASKTIGLGNLVHAGDEYENMRVELDETILPSHIFVTGTTGSGKSNAVYSILSKLKNEGKTFMVVEPAKGEYKDVFGPDPDVSVFGTNPKIHRLLRLNPFEFPDEVHISEHIDRLIDIFNACWPMYAAMPAVLKESMERAYVSCGWNLRTSESAYGIFPTFADVVRELNMYVDESEYSSDSKGDYKGALGTRLHSMCNGILGQIFSGESVSDETLFDSNVIVDLSRVGSIETKALIMGLLVMKLNEYRMSQGGKNLPLKHAVVLEEAHNLLKRTSSAQSSESANLIGKSVEMITSSIAEMRTFGECFIIADQSPSLLDYAAISNTNTKIIMALPGRLDRDIAGDSVGLSEGQKREVSRLGTGTAVVYQKGWEEAVLCHIDRYVYDETRTYSGVPDKDASMSDALPAIIYSIYAKGRQYDRRLMSYAVECAGMSGADKVRAIALIESAVALDKTFCERLVVACIGRGLYDMALKRRSHSDFNTVIARGIASFSDYMGPRLPTFMNLYVKGCMGPEKAACYDTWLAETVKSRNL